MSKFAATKDYGGCATTLIIQNTFDQKKPEAAANSGGEVLTVPTRRQMNSVKNQFEGYFQAL